MQVIWDFLRANPWIWAVMAVGAAVWIASLVVVIRVPKFRRKWLWALLTLCNFSYSWSAGPGLMVSVGIPLGALYVLWFWRFGPSPTAAQLAEDAERRARPPPVAAGWRVGLLRLAYLIALAAVALMGAAHLGGGVTAPESGDPAFDSLIGYVQAATFAAVAGLYILLVARPYPWGKIPCLLTAVAWGGFGLIAGQFEPRQWGDTWVLGAGGLMLAAGLLVQCVDGRWVGTYLRQRPA